MLNNEKEKLETLLAYCTMNTLITNYKYNDDNFKEEQKNQYSEAIGFILNDDEEFKKCMTLSTKQRQEFLLEHSNVKNNDKIVSELFKSCFTYVEMRIMLGISYTAIFKRTSPIKVKEAAKMLNCNSLDFYEIYLKTLILVKSIKRFKESDIKYDDLKEKMKSNMKNDLIENTVPSCSITNTLFLL